MERIVNDWQGPIYHLAYRMLGNEADAMDATQEVFARVLTRFHQWDPSRPVKPWLFRIATNVVLNMIRARRTRREHEVRKAEAAGRPSAGADLVAEREIQELVLARVRRLPADERILVGLHYLSGLSKSEAARVLSVPRTTVQSRIARALARLRSELEAAVLSIGALRIEEVLCDPTPPPVPPSLASNLAGLVADSGTAVSGPLVFSFGGILVSTKSIAAVAVLGVILLGVGILSGLGAGTSGEPGSSVTDISEIERLRSENEDLVRRLRNLEADADSGRPPREQAVGPAEPVEARPAPKDAADAGEEVSWERFSGLLVETFELLNTEEHTGSGLGPKTEANLSETWAEYIRMAERARGSSAAPFHDSAVLPALVAAIYCRPMGFEPEQDRRVRDAAAAAIRLHPVDLDRALPVEAYADRLKILNDILLALEDEIGEEDAQTWRTIRGLADSFVDGACDLYQVGLDRKPEDRVADVLGAWEKTYALDGREKEAAAPAARNLILQQAELFEQRGVETESQLVDDQARRELHIEMLRLQIRAEQSFLPMLSPEDLQAARKRSPAVIRVVPGSTELLILCLRGSI